MSSGKRAGWLESRGLGAVEPALPRGLTGAGLPQPPAQPGARGLGEGGCASGLPRY